MIGYSDIVLAMVLFVVAFLVCTISAAVIASRGG